MILFSQENSADSGVVTSDDWRRLYAAAVKVREMQLWKWMEEALEDARSSLEKFSP